MVTFRTATSGNSELTSTMRNDGEHSVRSKPVIEHVKWYNQGDNQEVAPLEIEVKILKEKLKQCELDRELVLSQLSQAAQTLQVP